MGYRNKTYVAFASEDIKSYWLMEAWRENENIDFNFYDAHDLYISRDTSTRETIKANLCQRLRNTAKQAVLLGSNRCRSKGGDGYSFLAYEIDVLLELQLPIVIANLDGTRVGKDSFTPQPLLDAQYYTMSVSFQPAIIKYALDDYASKFEPSNNAGGYHYKSTVYSGLGL